MSMVGTSRHPKRSLKPITFALALALPGSFALAAAMDDVVKTRADQNIDQQYGRDSVYAFSPDSKPLSPERKLNAQGTDMLSPHRTTANDSSLGSGYVGNEFSGNGSLGADSVSSEAAGSGYTDNVAYDAGSGYTGIDELTVIPLMSESAGAQYDRTYRTDQDQLAVLLPYDDATSRQFDRGYYEDPDLPAVVIVLQDSGAMNGEAVSDVSDSPTVAE